MGKETFKALCQKDQKHLKQQLVAELTKNGYKPDAKDGFIFATGTYPVLLVAHMDTVHKELPTTITELGDVISSPQGIGGDDRCGVYMILEIIKKYNCSVLFAEDEEVGGVGTQKFIDDETYLTWISENINYMIELDRANANDAVFYSNGNKEFQEWICDEETGLKLAYGSYTDISDLMPATGIAGVNISCGYYHAHTLSENVNFKEMETNIDRVCKILAREVEEPWMYEKSVSKYGSWGNWKDEYYGSYYGRGYYGYDEDYDEEYDESYEDYDESYHPRTTSKSSSKVKDFSKSAELENIFNDFENYTFELEDMIFMKFRYCTTKTVKEAIGYGYTDSAALGNFLATHPDTKYRDIVSYERFEIA